MGNAHIYMTKTDGSKLYSSAEFSQSSNNQFPPIVATGIQMIELLSGGPGKRAFVTLKITPASEINAAGPSSVLVIPESSTIANRNPGE